MALIDYVLSLLFVGVGIVFVIYFVLILKYTDWSRVQTTMAQVQYLSTGIWTKTAIKKNVQKNKQFQVTRTRLILVRFALTLVCVLLVSTVAGLYFAARSQST